jgi:hypothetical protein
MGVTTNRGRAGAEQMARQEHAEQGRLRYVRIPGTQRRLRSRTVVLGAVAALVAGGIVYDVSEPRHCVDANDRVVADTNCSGTGTGGGAHWYYGGRLRSGQMTGGGYERGGFGRVFGGFHGG